MKKYIIVMIACMLLLAGCEKENEDSMSNANNATEAGVEYVTAKEFMEYYSITENQVPADYVQAYIDDHRITPDRLDKENHLKQYLLSDYENGVIYGYNINRIFRWRKTSNENLSEYMKQAEVIMFQFNWPQGELSYTETMVIDLRESKIYFAKCGDKTGTEDYINFKHVAELSEDDIAAIRNELPEHIEENIKDSGRFDYTLSIHMLAADLTTKYFGGDGGNEEHFPGFNEYWKGLYKKYFGEEYEFTP